MTTALRQAGNDFTVHSEDNQVIGTIEVSHFTDTAKYLAYKGDRYLGQSETVEYAHKHYFA